MKHPDIVQAILEGRSVSLEVVGEEDKCIELKGALKSISQDIRCNDHIMPKNGYKLTLSIPPMGVEAMRQRVASALSQCTLSIHILQPD